MEAAGLFSAFSSKCLGTAIEFQRRGRWGKFYYRKLKGVGSAVWNSCFGNDAHDVVLQIGGGPIVVEVEVSEVFFNIMS